MAVCLERSKQHWKAGRWELAYVEAQEALQMSPSSSEAALLTKHSLYKLMPSKRLADRVDSLLVSAKECLRNTDFKGAVELATKAMKLGGSALYIRGRARAESGRWDLAYVDGSELIQSMVGYPTCNTLGLRDGAVKRITGYRLRKAELPLGLKTRQAEQSREIYRPSLWLGGSRIRMESLTIYWSGSRGPTCEFERDDGSYQTPSVRFADLPAFINENVAGSLRIIRLISDGWTLPPTEHELRRLLEIRPERLSGVEAVTLDRIDFWHISTASFEELFQRVLSSNRCYYFRQMRLPMGVKPASFIHPSEDGPYAALLRSYYIHFTRDELVHRGSLRVPPPAFPATKFSSGDIYNNLVTRAYTAGKESTLRGKEVLKPLLFITDNYLTGDGGVDEAVRLFKRLFVVEQNFITEKRACGYTATFGYSTPEAFLTSRYGEWKNRFGETFRICPMGVFFPDENSQSEMDNYQVTVSRESN